LTRQVNVERIMKYVFSVMVALAALGIVPASSDEIEAGVSLAWLDNPVSAASIRPDRADRERNTALIKEGESESPELIAVIESNREDRERMVVIDR
jgi:hypothetical protein